MKADTAPAIFSVAAGLPNAERNPFTLAYVAACIMHTPAFLADSEGMSLEELCLEAGDKAVEYLNNEFEEGQPIEFDAAHLQAWVNHHFI